MLMRYLPETGLDVEIRDGSGMREMVEQWESLSSRAAEDNVYYAPHYALSLLDTVSQSDRVTFVLVREGPKLVGLLPVTTAKMSIPGLTGVGSAWASAYTFSAMPLLDRSCAHQAAGALLGGLRRLGAGEWRIPAINLNGPAGQALVDALEVRAVPWRTTNSFNRASISTGTSFDDHMNAQIGSKRRRELARTRRRLEELGEVRHETCTSGEELKRAVDTFLSLEASGWKGKRGTALACSPKTTDFARNAFAGGQGSARCRADLLLVNDRPIAAGMIVFCGDTGFTIKGAYDEAFAKYSAGLLLEIEVIKSFFSEGWARRLDAATAGEHVIDRLWPDRVLVTDLVFSLASAAPAARLGSYVRELEWKARAKTRFKQIIGR